MTDEAVLVCSRLSDTPTPYVKSRTGFCDKCGAHVWVAESSPPADYLWCSACAAKAMDENDELEPLTHEQVEDVLNYCLRKGMS